MLRNAILLNHNHLSYIYIQLDVPCDEFYANRIETCFGFCVLDLYIFIFFYLSSNCNECIVNRRAQFEGARTTTFAPMIISPTNWDKSEILKPTSSTNVSQHTLGISR